MRNTKTKYALVSSIISIFLCAVMLIGTTFAWFTDEANTAVNTIQSGTLDVALVDDAGESLEGASLEWVKAQGEDAVLWEPGCTYETADAYIKNEGNLALKYKVLVNGIDGDAELLDVIDFKVLVDGEEVDVAEFEGDLAAGDEEAIVIKAHMDEEAGNEYQDKKIEGISITVKAAQDTVEYDSYDNQYDADATYADEAADEEEPTEPEAPVEPEVPEEPDNTVREAIVIPEDADQYTTYNYENMTVEAENMLIIKRNIMNAPAGIFLSNITATVDNLIILEENNAIMIVDSNITLAEGGKLVVNNASYGSKVMIKNVTVNGELLTAANAADYFTNVADFMFA